MRISKIQYSFIEAFLFLAVVGSLLIAYVFLTTSIANRSASLNNKNKTELIRKG